METDVSQSPELEIVDSDVIKTPLKPLMASAGSNHIGQKIENSNFYCVFISK